MPRPHNLISSDKNCGKATSVTRRDCLRDCLRNSLRAGGLGLLGQTFLEMCNLGLGGLELSQLRAAAPAKGPQAAERRSNACVFIFLFGGPSHIDLWDMKPNAPLEIRGEFKPAATNVPGIQVCEHLPRLAKQMDKLALLRSMTHNMPVHGPACSELYTGREYFGPPTTDQATPEDWPSLSSLVTRFGKSDRQLPASVVLPLHSQFIGQSKRIAGQTGGRMGERFSPLLVQCDPSLKEFEYAGFKLQPDIGLRRLESRKQLLNRLQSPIAEGKAFGPAAEEYQGHTETAFSLLHQVEFQRALDLRRVPEKRRERYGMTKFGQSLLLAARLIESGIPLVTVNFDHESKFDKRSPMWDTHHDNFAKLKDPLCPLFDQAFSAFIEDLSERGQLDSTLVVATGEFGRTPRIGQFSQNAMTLKTGRDHWPHAFTAILAGGGVRGGQVYGATNRNAGYVADKPVSPADLSATMLHHLGIDATHEYHDEFQNVARKLSLGKPIVDLG